VYSCCVFHLADKYSENFVIISVKDHDNRCLLVKIFLSSSLRDAVDGMVIFLLLMHCVMLWCFVGSHPPACIVIAAETLCSSATRDARSAAEARQLQHICTASLSGGGIVYDTDKLCICL